MPDLTLYIRKDCHLCFDMISGLNKLQEKFGFHFKLIDVDSNVILKEKYGNFVPVLKGENGEEICHFYLDPKALDAYLVKIR